MKAKARGQAGEWRARQVTKTLSAPRGELIAWLRTAPKAAAVRSTRTAAPRWKCGASINLSLIDAGPTWDSTSAALGIFDACGLSSGPWSDGYLARRGFLAYNASAPNLKSSYKLPFARIIDGVLTADREGLEVAARDLAKAELPDDTKAKARAVITFYRVGH